jgi:hypothetical protein
MNKCIPHHNLTLLLHVLHKAFVLLQSYSGTSKQNHKMAKQHIKRLQQLPRSSKIWNWRRVGVTGLPQHTHTLRNIQASCYKLLSFNLINKSWICLCKYS